MKEEPAAGHRADHAAIYVPPPLLYVAAFTLGLLLHRAWPWRPLPDVVALPLAMGFLAIWAGLTLWAALTLRRARTTILPMRPSARLVTHGPFGLSRNPLYLALAALYLGIASWVNTGWPVILFVPLLLVVQRKVIEREERYLERRFGEEYRDYRRRVRRWL